VESSVSIPLFSNSNYRSISPVAPLRTRDLLSIWLSNLPGKPEGSRIADYEIMGGILETPPRRLIRPSLLFTEVSPLCICHRLPRVATPILTHPLYRSLPEEVLARSESTWLGILTPIQVNVPFGLVFNCQVTVKFEVISPFTTT
jgi:hypothetical protein